jgi:hypothetical protein
MYTKLINKLFSTELVNSYADNNYFGCESDGYSEDQQKAIREAWIENMAKRGIRLNEYYIILETELAYFNNEYWYDDQCDKALFEVHQQLLNN